MLALSSYRDLIHLDEPFELPVDDQRADRDLLLTALEGLPNKHYTGGSMSSHLSTDRGLLRWLEAELSLRDPGPIDPISSRAINTLLLRESGRHGRVEGAYLRRVSELFPECDYLWAHNTAIYLGDIRQMVIDAVVNSALPDLTGCRIPLHGCLDSVIQHQSGPWVRNDLAVIQEQLDGPAEPGETVITRGYRLPARYIVHTLVPENGGHPNVGDGAMDAPEFDQLRSCYLNTLSLVHEMGNIKSIAFPAISTGLNGFPFELAARTALQAVDEWMRRHENELELVVFALHSDQDLASFTRVLTTWIND